MAASASIAPAGASSPVNLPEFTGSPSTTRRGAVAALFGAAGAVAVASCGARPALARDAGRAAWDRALREYQAAREALSAFWRDVQAPAYAEFNRRVERVELKFTVTARNGSTATYCPTPAELDQYCEHIGFQLREGARDLRDRWRKYQAESTAWRARLDLDAIDDRGEALTDAEYEAEAALFATPAPDAQEFARKVALLLQYDLRDDRYDALRAEAAALAGVAVERVAS